MNRFFHTLSSKQQAEIAKAITGCGGHSNNERYFATRAIIWEIAMGQSPRSGSVYKAVITPNAGKLGSYYEEIRSEMESSGEIPSFMNPDPNDPALHKMEESGGSWSIDLTNTNSKVSLSASDFTSRAPFNFSVRGNTLTVTSGSEPDNDSFVEWHGGGEGSGPSGTSHTATGTRPVRSNPPAAAPTDKPARSTRPVTPPVREDKKSENGSTRSTRRDEPSQ